MPIEANTVQYSDTNAIHLPGDVVVVVDELVVEQSC